MKLRTYQSDIKRRVYDAWRQYDNVLAICATGGGKTVIMSKILQEMDCPSVAIAHRQELVSQMSLALNRCGVYHKVVAPRDTIKDCVNIHMMTDGVTYYRASAKVAVASVDTLARRPHTLDGIKLWIVDEAAHLLGRNKWGKAVSQFHGAKGLGVTACPRRCDGLGLGDDGVFQHMIAGPDTRTLIDEGYLTDYRIIAPPTDLHLTNEDVSKTTGEYKSKNLVSKTRASTITGDIVEHYLRHAAGKSGLTFVTDVLSAEETAEKYRNAGVKAVSLSAKTPAMERAKIMQRLRDGELQQIVNVDILGEGTDVPALDVISLGRKTQSLSVMLQQVGRVLRPVYASNMPLDTIEQRKTAIAKGPKPIATIIDHVGNCTGDHGLPDIKRVWSLSRRSKRSLPDDDIEPVRTCENCLHVYSRFKSMCPHCNHVRTITRRDGPEYVDGDLMELDAETLARMREAVERVDGPALIPYGASPVVENSIRKRHRERQAEQMRLRDAMAQWCGDRRAEGMSNSEIYRGFYFKFGCDIMTAKTLGKKEASELTERIK